MKAWKIIYSIICVPIICFMVYQTYTVNKWSNDIGGILGYFVAVIFCAIIVVTIASLRADAKSILNIIIGALGIAAAIFGFIGSQGIFTDLFVYAIWGIICAVFPLISGISSIIKDRQK